MGSRPDVVVNVYYNFTIGVVSNATNVSNETENVDYKWSLEFSVILAIILSISAFFTIVGNSMVLMVIIRHRGMRTRTNLFLVNLAVADLLVGLLVMPFTITTLITNTWIFGTFMCKVNGWMNGFCLITSFHTLMYISIHKYYSIVRPLSNPLKLTYIIAMMAAAWLWAAIGSTLNITVLVIVHKPGTSQCGPRYPSNMRMFITHGILQLTVILLPATILVFCYVRMFMEIRKHSQRLRTNSTVEEDFILSQQKKVAVTLFIVLATFVMMALPYFAYATYTTIKKDKKHFSSYINPLAYTFLYLSSMCNPIIYAFRSPAFRQGYKEILCRTPNYVISDDSEITGRSRRLSSLIGNLRRASAPESRHSMHYIDRRVLILETPVSKHQKSLFKLLRSTRQSRSQSVVHRNGDIIIMKGGKIVSVRRAGEGRDGSPLMNRLKALKQTTQSGSDLLSGLSGPGHVMFGIVCDEAAEEHKGLVVMNDIDNVSVGSDDVFSQIAGNRLKEVPQLQDTPKVGFGVIENETDTSRINKVSKLERSNYDLDAFKVESSENIDGKKSLECNIINSPTDIQKPPNYNDILNEISASQMCGDKRNGKKHRSNLPYLLTSLADKSAGADSPFHSEDLDVVVCVNRDDDPLSVMPLTPYTRDSLAKSDLHVSHTDPIIAQDKGDSKALMLRSLQASHSSENLFRKPPAVQRLMSVEFLDSPIRLFGSKSNATNRQIEKSKLHKKKHPGSTEGKLNSKTLCLRSPFTTRKIITQV